MTKPSLKEFGFYFKLLLFFILQTVVFYVQMSAISYAGLGSGDPSFDEWNSLTLNKLITTDVGVYNVSTNPYVQGVNIAHQSTIQSNNLYSIYGTFVGEKSAVGSPLKIGSRGSSDTSNPEIINALTENGNTVVNTVNYFWSDGDKILGNSTNNTCTAITSGLGNSARIVKTETGSVIQCKIIGIATEYKENGEIGNKGILRETGNNPDENSVSAPRIVIAYTKNSADLKVLFIEPASCELKDEEILFTNSNIRNIQTAFYDNKVDPATNFIVWEDGTTIKGIAFRYSLANENIIILTPWTGGKTIATDSDSPVIKTDPSNGDLYIAYRRSTDNSIWIKRIKNDSTASEPFNVKVSGDKNPADKQQLAVIPSSNAAVKAITVFVHNGDIYANAIDQNGQEKWSSNLIREPGQGTIASNDGVQSICTASGEQTDPRISCDPLRNSFNVVWTDKRVNPLQIYWTARSIDRFSLLDANPNPENGSKISFGSNLSSSSNQDSATITPYRNDDVFQVIRSGSNSLTIWKQQSNSGLFCQFSNQRGTRIIPNTPLISSVIPTSEGNVIRIDSGSIDKIKWNSLSLIVTSEQTINGSNISIIIYQGALTDAVVDATSKEGSVKYTAGVIGTIGQASANSDSHYNFAANPIPNAPTNLTVSSPALNTVSLEFTDNSNIETEFAVIRNAGSLTSIKRIARRINTGNVEFIDTVDAGTYTYFIAALNKISGSLELYSKPSNSATITVAGTISNNPKTPKFIPDTLSTLNPPGSTAKRHKKGRGKPACYIATSSFGYKSVDVRSLTNFRDSYFLSNQAGTISIATYNNIAQKISFSISGNLTAQHLGKVNLGIILKSCTQNFIFISILSCLICLGTFIRIRSKG
ncbi:MAG: hypothetical protein HY606_10265 [Planctomycetes bacterium]|nr:hypothetical protein [Planctomycetota bacterium]